MLIELVIISPEFMSFSFNVQYFDQKDELFVGSPKSPTFSELYIERVEEIHVYRIINAPCLWLKKVNGFLISSKKQCH